MRFMAIVKGDEKYEAGAMPTEQELAEMGNYNEELVNAGKMLAGEGLHPTSKASRIRYSGDKRTVVNGPFPEAKDLTAGFWMLQADSLQDAVDLLKRAPFREGEVEIRQVFEADDFGDEFTPELKEQEERIRRQAAGRQ
jgi:hypothetical protein